MSVEREVYLWGDYRLNVARRTLFRGPNQIKLPGLPFDVLVFLIRNRNRMCPKEEIFEAAWHDRLDTTFDSNLIDRAISTTRLACDDPGLSAWLRVERGKGIIFDADVDQEGPVQQPDASISAYEAPKIEPPEPAANEAADTANSDAVEVPIRELPKFGVRRSNMLWLAVIGVVLVSTFAVLWIGWNPGPEVAPEPRPLTRTGNTKFAPLVVVENPRRVLFTEMLNGRYRISWVQTQRGNAGNLDVDLANPTVVAVSPDGKTLLLRDIAAGFQDDAPLYFQSLNGGEPIRLGINGFDGEWSPDGSWIALTRNGAIVRYTSATRTFQEIFRDNGTGYAWWPRFSPNGTRLRFSILDGNPQVNSLWELNLSTRHATRLSPLGSEWATAAAGTWNADGDDFFFHVGQGAGPFTLWWMPGGSGFRRLLFRPRSITTGPVSFRSPQPDPGGQYIYARGLLARSEMADVSLMDDSIRTILPDKFPAIVSYSNDGKSLVYYSTNPEESLWKATSTGTASQVLIRHPIQSSTPQWSPDNQRVAVATRYPGQPWRLLLISPDSGAQDELNTIDTNAISPTWSPHGDQIMFGTIPTVEKDKSRINIYIVDLNTRKVSAVPGTQGLYQPAWSPDGQYIAALASDTNAIKILNLREHRWLSASAGKASYIVWARDSAGFFFVNGEQSGLAIKHCSVPSMETTTMRVLEDFRQFGSWIGIAGDGSLLVPKDLSTQEIYQLSIR